MPNVAEFALLLSLVPMRTNPPPASYGTSTSDTRAGEKEKRSMTIRILTIPLILTLGSITFGAGAQDAECKPDGKGKPEVLYVWAGDQAHKAPDFLAVIDFDEDSRSYGRVIDTVPLPPPGNLDNEPHHCHLNSTKTVLACGGLLSLLKGQNGIFFFDVSNAKKPRFMFSAKAVESSMTDDFLPIEDGGFLITQMGSATGMAPGRVAEFDGRLHFIANHFGNE